jgi:hypothetical protein
VFERLAASFLGMHLGCPTWSGQRRVRRHHGDEFVVQQTAPDGMTIVTGSSTTADPPPSASRSRISDPTALASWACRRGGSAILIGKEAGRASTTRVRPVVMGAPAGIPRRACR